MLYIEPRGSVSGNGRKAYGRRRWRDAAGLCPSISYQQILGMGGALTEGAAYTYARMSAEKQQQLLALFFGDGNHYNFCRLHIQSCDFALGNYAYVEDAKDTGLDSFSIERDRKYIIPFAKAALEKTAKYNFLRHRGARPHL